MADHTEFLDAVGLQAAITEALTKTWNMLWEGYADDGIYGFGLDTVGDPFLLPASFTEAGYTQIQDKHAGSRWTPAESATHLIGEEFFTEVNDLIQQAMDAHGDWEDSLGDYIDDSGVVWVEHVVSTTKVIFSAADDGQPHPTSYLEGDELAANLADVQGSTKPPGGQQAPVDEMAVYADMCMAIFNAGISALHGLREVGVFRSAPNLVLNLWHMEREPTAENIAHRCNPSHIAEAYLSELPKEWPNHQ